MAIQLMIQKGNSHIDSNALETDAQPENTLVKVKNMTAKAPKKKR